MRTGSRRHPRREAAGLAMAPARRVRPSAAVRRPLEARRGHAAVSIDSRAPRPHARESARAGVMCRQTESCRRRLRGAPHCAGWPRPHCERPPPTRGRGRRVALAARPMVRWPQGFVARRAARARTPPGPTGSCSSTGRHPTRSRVIGRRRRDRQSGGHRRLSNEHVDDEILCAVVVALEVSKECKTKERGKSAIGTSGARGWTCPESLPQGWLSRPRRPVVSLSCALLERLLPKNGITWISCALSSCSSRSIDRLGYRRCAAAKSVFYSADQKISLVPPRRDLGRLQS